MLHKVRRWIHSYFGFNKRESNGLLILMVLTVAILLAPFLLRLADSDDKLIVYKDEITLDSLVAEMERKDPESSTGKRGPTLVKFNPNEASVADLERLGLPDWLAERIVNYRHAGGRFAVKKDLLKIYGFDERHYSRLEHFIDLPEEVHASKEDAAADKAETKSERVERAVAVKFDINEADTAALQDIYGIGPTLSQRIVGFRRLLGGFVSPEQFAEVYGLKDDALMNLRRNSFIAEGFQPIKLNINFSDPQTLAKHPYISFELAGHIVEHRSRFGPYKDFQSLQAAGFLPDSVSRQLRFYLSY